MNRFIYILLLFPTLLYFQGEKELCKHPFISGDFHFENKIDRKDFNEYHFAKSLQNTNATYHFDLKTNQYNKTLQNFEKQNKVLDFVEKIDFRNKVAKTRNKDYLNLDKNI